MPSSHNDSFLRFSDEVKIVFVLSNGAEYCVDPELYAELSIVFPWMISRAGEFQKLINEMMEKTAPDAVSILKLFSNGDNRVLLNLNKRQYS